MVWRWKRFLDWTSVKRVRWRWSRGRLYAPQPPAFQVRRYRLHSTGPRPITVGAAIGQTSPNHGRRALHRKGSDYNKSLTTASSITTPASPANYLHIIRQHPSKRHVNDNPSSSSVPRSAYSASAATLSCHHANDQSAHRRPNARCTCLNELSVQRTAIVMSSRSHAAPRKAQAQRCQKRNLDIRP